MQRGRLAASLFHTHPCIRALALLVGTTIVKAATTRLLTLHYHLTSSCKQQTTQQAVHTTTRRQATHTHVLAPPSSSGRPGRALHRSGAAEESQWRRRTTRSTCVRAAECNALWDPAASWYTLEIADAANWLYISPLVVRQLQRHFWCGAAGIWRRMCRPWLGWRRGVRGRHSAASTGLAVRPPLHCRKHHFVVSVLPLRDGDARRCPTP